MCAIGTGDPTLLVEELKKEREVLIHETKTTMAYTPYLHSMVEMAKLRLRRTERSQQLWYIIAFLYFFVGSIIIAIEQLKYSMMDKSERTPHGLARVSHCPITFYLLWSNSDKRVTLLPERTILVLKSALLLIN